MATITYEKFTIFGSGFNRTRIDSGLGEGDFFFSHPYVPLNSVNYAGQYYFEVPDEHGDLFDAVKDDIAHCTFEPAIGTTFDTEGAVTIKASYYREYEIGQTTLVIHKTFKQTIEVVDHGTVSTRGTYADLYSDGYHFWRPRSVSEVAGYQLEGTGSPSKTSNIMWRAVALGRGIYSFLQSNNLTDISELAHADLSHVTGMYRLFYECRNLSDLSALADWDVSNVQAMENLFTNVPISDFSFLSKWNTPNMTSLYSTFNGCLVTSLHGLENWDVSNVTNMMNAFNGCRQLTSISALSKWDVSKVTSLQSTFTTCLALTSLHGLEDWDVSAVTNMMGTFQGCNALRSLEALGDWTPHPTTMRECFNSCYALVTLEGLENFDTSGITADPAFYQTFSNLPKLLSLKGIETWDVSNAQSFREMCAYNPWLSDISALDSWDFSSATNLSSMFLNMADITTLDGIDLDLPNVAYMDSMFGGFDVYIGEVTLPGGQQVTKRLWANAYYYFDYDGNQYSPLGVTATTIEKDASNAQNWTVNISGANAFSRGTWNNKPSWD